ncbi:MAG: hypothetical protein MK098_02925 [Marinovum sp.]|nr:hypothetical protein [Marinovum sp.]
MAKPITHYGASTERMPNAIAYLVLAAWPIVTVVMFRRLPMNLAFIWSMLIGYLILPPQPAVFDFPLMPPLHKENIPALAAFITVMSMKGIQTSLLPDSLSARVLMLVFIFSPVMTVANNGHPVYWGELVLPSLGVTDAIALTITQFLLLLPFMMARQFLYEGASQRHLICAFMLGGLAYSLPVLLEVRLSPQLNVWIYGYFQGIFSQTVRFGGWRPTVFLYHGLWVAFYMMMALVAAAAMFKFEKKRRWTWFGAFLYLFAVLVLCKSLGSLLFAIFLVPLILFFSARFQIKVAAVIALLAIAYPVLKGTEILPSQAILDQAERIDEERSGSLRFRFFNEDILLERAYEKPIFGWGSWGRNHIWNDVSGALETVTDGRWIITIGVYGWIGFLAEFGLIVLPIFLLWREMLGRRNDEISPHIGPLSLILSINAIDMIPNATLTPLTWLLSGALLGYAEHLRRTRDERDVTSMLKWRPAMQ